MRTQTIEGFLAELADRVPAPGGGASAALHAAQGAALVAMVARYSDGERFAPHADAITEIRDRCDELRDLALDLAVEDARAFSAVAEAYALPRSDDAATAHRSEAIATALAGAGRVPARVIEVTEQILTLAETLRPIGNRTVVTDIAAAAEALRAAAGTARVNVEVNLVGLADPAIREELLEGIDHVDDLVLRAAKVTAAVREQILR